MIMRSILFILSLVLTAVCGLSQSFESDGLWYRITDDGRAVVTEPERGTYDGVVIIPGYVYYGGENHHITAIDSAAFAGSKVTHVVVPNGVTAMGKGAFANTAELRGVTLPATLSRIEAETFMASNLTSLAVPEGVKEIGERAFSDCGNLRWLFLPRSLKKVGAEALDYCYNLSEIHMAGDAVLKGAAAFRDLRGTDVVTCADSVTVAYEQSDEWQDVGGVMFYTADSFDLTMDMEADVVNGSWAHFALPEGLAYEIYDDVDSLIGLASASDVYLPILKQDMDYRIVPTTLTSSSEPLVARVPSRMAPPSQTASVIGDKDFTTEGPNIYASGGVIYITGDNYGKWLWIHDVYGNLWLERPACEGNVGFLPPGKVYIVRVGDTVKKVVL